MGTTRKLAAAAIVLAGVGAALAVTTGPNDARYPPVRKVAVGLARPAGAPGVAGGPTVVMVRRAGGVPAGWTRRLRRIDGVLAVAEVRRAQAMLRGTARTDRARGEKIRAGFAVPMDTLVIEPRRYSAMLPAPESRLVRRLRRGSVLLSRTSARLRRAAPGSTLTLVGGRRLRVIAVIDDGLVRGAELVVTGADGRALGDRAPYLLAAVRSPDTVKRASEAFDGPRSRVTELGRAPWPVAGRIARPAQLKVRFGEFALRLPVDPDWVRIDPGWLRRNIVTRSVPILGRVSCHRRMLPALRGALAELERRGLASLVDPGDYAGCYAPRRIPGSGTLSLHAWGVAIDLNASRNPQGARPRQDRRLVRIMERWGFSWGGRWPTVPDGMHFEYHGAR